MTMAKFSIFPALNALEKIHSYPTNRVTIAVVITSIIYVATQTPTRCDHRKLVLVITSKLAFTSINSGNDANQFKAVFSGRFPKKIKLIENNIILVISMICHFVLNRMHYCSPR